jgi:hypothetical protein
MNRFSRRTFLRGASGASFALPLLSDVLRGSTARAAAPAFPKRLFVFFTPNGTIPAEFFGPADQSTFTLGQILAPLEPHKKDLLVLDNLDNKASIDASGDPHGVGFGCMLSGMKLLTGAAAMGMTSGGWSSGISVDQYVANTIGKSTKLASLELAGKDIAGSVFSRMSFSGPGQPLSPEADPQKAFDRIFASVMNDPASLRRRALQTSILDEVSKQLDGLSATLSGADQMKVQAHAAYVRDIETRLQASAPGSCTTAPARPTVSGSKPVDFMPYDPNNAGHEVINAANDVDFPGILKAHLDLVVGAFSCDITRVASLMAAPSRSDVVMTWAGVTMSHHEMSHQSDAQGMPGLIKVDNWYAQQLAYLISALKAVPEGAGTVFDNTLILWCNELGIGNIHSHTKLPLLIAAGKSTGFKTGQAVTMPSGTPHNRILLSLIHGMGMTDVTSFGNPKFCTAGPIQEIMA